MHRTHIFNDVQPASTAARTPTAPSASRRNVRYGQRYLRHAQSSAREALRRGVPQPPRPSFASPQVATASLAGCSRACIAEGLRSILSLNVHIALLWNGVDKASNEMH